MIPKKNYISNYNFIANNFKNKKGSLFLLSKYNSYIINFNSEKKGKQIKSDAMSVLLWYGC